MVDRRLGAAIVACVIGAALVGIAAPAAAANPPIVVTTTADVVDADDGQTALREAIALAGSTAGDDIVQLATNETYPLTLCDPNLFDAVDLGGSLDHLAESDGLTIEGAGSVIQGGTTCPDRVLVSRSEGLLTLLHLTVQGGRDSPDHHETVGGGVFAQGDVEGSDVHLLDNRTELTPLGLGVPHAAGGGLFASGDVTLESSEIAENVSRGGGGVAGQDVTLIDSTVRDNQARSGGGAEARHDLTIQNTQVFGNSSGSGQYRDFTYYYEGGGLEAANHVRVLAGSVVSENRSVRGGAGIHSFGDVTVEESVVRDNVADGLGSLGQGPCNSNGQCTGGPQYGQTSGRGAGVNAEGDLVVRRSTISGNVFDPGATVPLPSQTFWHPLGAGLYARESVTIEESTVSGNDSLGRSRVGGVRAGGDLTVRNSTVSGNRAEDGVGGGLSAGGVLRLRHATIIRNAAPDGANVHASGPLSLTRSVISRGIGGPACRILGGASSGGYNVTQGGTFGNRCGTGSGPGDRPLVPGLGLRPLEDNGGPTFTHLPVGTALSIIPPVACTTTVDQRAQPRPQGTACEAGSVEIP